MGPDDLESAKEAIGALLDAQGLRERPSREQYHAALRLLEVKYPAIYLNLTGRSLYELVRKGSLAVPAQVLREHRESRALQTQTRWTTPIPQNARDMLVEQLEQMWALVYPVARRETEDVLGYRAALLEEQRDNAQREHKAGLLRNDRLKSDNDALAARMAAVSAHNTELLALTATLSEQYDKLKRELESVKADSQRRVDEEHARVEQLTEALDRASAAYDGLSHRALADVDAARQETLKLRERHEALSQSLKEAREALVAEQRRCSALEDELLAMKRKPTPQSIRQKLAARKAHPLRNHRDLA